jgi:hypothetical protein
MSVLEDNLHENTNFTKKRLKIKKKFYFTEMIYEFPTCGFLHGTALLESLFLINSFFAYGFEFAKVFEFNVEKQLSMAPTIE